MDAWIIGFFAGVCVTIGIPLGAFMIHTLIQTVTEVNKKRASEKLVVPKKLTNEEVVKVRLFYPGQAVHVHLEGGQVISAVFIRYLMFNQGYVEIAGDFGKFESSVNLNQIEPANV
jgi:hypothetical protein